MYEHFVALHRDYGVKMCTACRVREADQSAKLDTESESIQYSGAQKYSCIRAFITYPERTGAHRFVDVNGTAHLDNCHVSSSTSATRTNGIAVLTTADQTAMSQQGVNQEKPKF